TTTTAAPSTTTTATTAPATTTTAESTTTSSLQPAPSTTTTTAAGSCPAEKVLGQDNRGLESLRALRDSRLARSAEGRRLIKLYYAHAGSINAALDRSPALRAVTRQWLEAIAHLQNKKEE
ncbi:MAG: hypothetical protein JW832_06815, partial [Deltaproteobacteria bacterium]|nr:hypothetical protein [Deltaproteobacteria bacterium]